MKIEKHFCLSEKQADYLRERFKGVTGEICETVSLPHELGPVPCHLYGPMCCDDSVPDYSLHDEWSTDGGKVEDRRGNGGAVYAHARRLVGLPVRFTFEVTVIASPPPGYTEPVLHLAYGGPYRPLDPTIEQNKRSLDHFELPEATKFWREHALSCEILDDELFDAKGIDVYKHAADRVAKQRLIEGELL